MTKKTNPNHKFSAVYMVEAQCSCGWRGVAWCGKGARSNAVAEWHSHVERCDLAKK